MMHVEEATGRQEVSTARWAWRIATALVLLGAVAPEIVASELRELQILTDCDPGMSDRFGASVAISGDVGAVGVSSDGTDWTGAVYVYRFNGIAWSKEQKLLASDGQFNDQFGASVALDGELLAIGAPWDDDDGNESGSVYMFRHNGVSWIEEQKIRSASQGVRFGTHVAVSDDVLLVGAPLDAEEGGNAGAAHVFRYDGKSWIHEQKLTACNAEFNDQFGSSVAVDNGVALVGSPGNFGSAYLYRFNGSGWNEEQELTGDGGLDLFGASVSLSDDIAVVGAWEDEKVLTASGSAFAFHFDGTIWQRQPKIRAIDPGAHDQFGWSVSVSGRIMLIGSRNDANGAGSAYLFYYDGWEWKHQTKLVASDAEEGDLFGSSVAVSSDLLVGDIALVGAPSAEAPFVESGAAYAFVDELLVCLDGTVNAGAGSVTDCLYVNGSVGGLGRIVDVRAGDLIYALLLRPPSGGSGKFVVHMNGGLGAVALERSIPGGVGTTCFPFLFPEASPLSIWNNLGKDAIVGSTSYFGTPKADPAPASTVFLTLHGGDAENLPIGTVVSLQGLIVDPATLGTKGASTTNAVRMRIVP